jgi:hypothetical protein
MYGAGPDLTNRRWPTWYPAWLLALAMVSFGGCYDGEALVELARAEAIQSQLDEVELGAYRTTLPRDENSAATTEIEFEIFGNAPHYRVAEITQQLATDGYRLRYGVITEVRQATAEELGEPNLTALKERFKEVANQVLANAPITSIGVKRLRFVHR